MTREASILIVDDEPAMCEVLEELSPTTATVCAWPGRCGNIGKSGRIPYRTRPR